MTYQFDRQFAQQMDEQDALRSFRQRFQFPNALGQDVIYYTGNSLGLMPLEAGTAVNAQLDKWGTQAVEGHFTGDDAWFNFHKRTKKGLAYLVGAKESEVVLMNGLTNNLHLLMVSFYRPVPGRYKILLESKAFPSDHYVAESQLRYHGFSPKDGIVEVEPDKGHIISTQKILETIDRHADELALLMLSGINYYTGQRFDMERITAYAREKGITVGWDLAHAAGNVELELHDWGADFAAWCTYKYLNSGPGAPSGLFVHERHQNDPDLPRFAGWWGYDQATRFQMEPGFKPMTGADGWQQSNGPVLAMAAVEPAVNMFCEAGKEKLFAKRDRLTGYLEFVLHRWKEKYNLDQVALLTPEDPRERGSQLSVYVGDLGKSLFDGLMERQVITDWREPGVMRFAPTPMYNSFTDVYRTGVILDEYMDSRI